MVQLISNLFAEVISNPHPCISIYTDFCAERYDQEIASSKLWRHGCAAESLVDFGGERLIPFRELDRRFHRRFWRMSEFPISLQI